MLGGSPHAFPCPPAALGAPPGIDACRGKQEWVCFPPLQEHTCAHAHTLMHMHTHIYPAPAMGQGWIRRSREHLPLACLTAGLSPGPPAHPDRVWMLLSAAQFGLGVSSRSQCLHSASSPLGHAHTCTCMHTYAHAPQCMLPIPVLSLLTVTPLPRPQLSFQDPSGGTGSHLSCPAVPVAAAWLAQAWALWDPLIAPGASLPASLPALIVSDLTVVTLGLMAQALAAFWLIGYDFFQH